jgi:hypothetical protein
MNLGSFKKIRCVVLVPILPLQTAIAQRFSTRQKEASLKASAQERRREKRKVRPLTNETCASKIPHSPVGCLRHDRPGNANIVFIYCN